MPLLLTVDDAADLLQTTRRAIYAMLERRQPPGVIRIRRRVLIRSAELLPKKAASFHDFDEFERLVEVAQSEVFGLLVVLLGGEAGLRCGNRHATLRLQPWRPPG